MSSSKPSPEAGSALPRSTLTRCQEGGFRVSQLFSRQPLGTGHLLPNTEASERSSSLQSLPPSSSQRLEKGLLQTPAGNTVSFENETLTEQTCRKEMKANAGHQTCTMLLLSVWDFSECMDTLFRPVTFRTASLSRSAPSRQSTNTSTGGLKSFLSWK